MKIMITGKPTCHLEKHKQDLTYGEFMVWIQQGKLKKKQNYQNMRLEPLCAWR